MKKLLLLFMFPLMAQTINDTDDAKREYRESTREQEQMRQEQEWEKKDQYRKKTIEENDGYISSHIIEPPDNFLNKKFPTIKGISLSNNEVVFPEAIRGRVAVLSIAFKQRAQLCINTWADELLPKYGINKSVQYYEVPMLGGQYKMMRNWIDGGMQNGVPKPLHDFTVTYYGPLKKYYKSLGIDSKKNCYIYVLDQDGIIKGRFDGFATPEKLSELFTLIDSLNE